MQSRFSGPIPEGLEVIETMRAEADGSVAHWNLHLARLRRDCEAVGYPLDEDAVGAAFVELPHGVLRVRLAIGSQGKVTLTYQPLPAKPSFWRVAISPHRLQSDDPWLRIKTTYRPIYDAARADMLENCDEVILLNERGEICEGSITNIFLRRAGRLLTPPLSCGVLPGVLRQSLLHKKEAEETILFPESFVDGDLFCGNALRGLIPARLMNEGAVI